MRFGFLVDHEVPYGQAMLSTLLDAALVPEVLIDEESPDAEHHRNLFLGRMTGNRSWPSITSQISAHKLTVYKTSNLNSPEVQGILTDAHLDIIVLGGTRRFIAKSVFSIAPWGALCSHPGLLPWVRGASSPAWSIYHDIQVGCSCVVIDEGLDTGPIVETTVVPVYRGESYPEVVERNIEACAQLMAEVLHRFERLGGQVEAEPQDLALGKTYPTMPPALVEEVKRKLAEGRYRWLEDR